MVSKTDWRPLERSAILVVDDDPGVRDTITRGLERSDYDVLAAGTLGEARNALSSRDFGQVTASVSALDRAKDLLQSLA